MGEPVDDEGDPSVSDDLLRQDTAQRGPPTSLSTASLPTRKHASPSIRSDDLRPGVTMQRYVLIERIGRGGMGDVFVAHDPQLDRRLALKVLRHEAPGSRTARDRERLRREAKALAQLSHPNVVDVFDVGTWRDRTFIAMELVEGTDLRRWLRQSEHPQEERLAMLIEAGRGLAAAHAAGIVHRDFKPANVMLGDDGRVCVLDFGLATGGKSSPEPELAAAPEEPVDRDVRGVDLPTLTQSGITVGTPAYMAPEQHRGDVVDPRSDQFGFCVSLFEAMVGSRPFPGSDPSCLLRAKDDHHIQPLPEDRTISPWLMAIIERGLRPDPEDRFPSMQALLAALERRSPTRRRTRVLMATVLAGSLAVLGGVWLTASSPSPCERASGQLAEQWSDAHARTIRQAFSETGLSYAETSFDRVVETLDTHAQQWLERHHDACEAAASGDASQTAGHDRQLQCLARNLEQLGATVQVLSEADADTVRRATRIVAALPSTDHCDTAEERVVGPAPPTDPALAQKVERLRGRHTTAEVLREAGRYRDGILLARSVLDEAMGLDYPPLQIEARRLVGQLLLAQGEYAAAEEPLVEAAMAAQALPYDEEAIPAMIDLVMVLGVKLGRTDEASTWSEHARAALHRAPDPRAEARLLGTEAAVAMVTGHYDDSRERAEQALALRRAVLGDGHADLVGSHNNLANALWRMGRMEPAEHHYTRALEIAELAHGKDHPLVATLLQNLGGLMGAQGKYAEARTALERGLRIRRRALGPRNVEVGNMLNNLGSVRWEMGEREEAIAMLREALDIQEDALGSEDPRLVPMLHNLADLSMTRGDIDDARGYAQRALGLLERNREPGHPRQIHTLTVLGRIALHEDELATAREYLGRALTLAGQQEGGVPLMAAGTHEALGRVELQAGDPAKAAEHFEQALETLEASGQTDESLAALRFSLARAWTRNGEDPDRVAPLVDRALAHAEPELSAEIRAWQARGETPSPASP